MNNIDWGLIHLIQDTLDMLQEDCDWDLDSFETIKLTKSLYNSCHAINRFYSPNYFNENVVWADEQIKNVLEQARLDCWGVNHTCDKPSQKEVDTLRRLFDSDVLQDFSELGWNKYVC